MEAAKVGGSRWLLDGEDGCWYVADEGGGRFPVAVVGGDMGDSRRLLLVVGEMVSGERERERDVGGVF